MRRVKIRICSACSMGQHVSDPSKNACVSCGVPFSDDAFHSKPESFLADELTVAKEGKTALLIALQFTGLPDSLRGSILLSTLILPATLLPMMLYGNGSLTIGSALGCSLTLFMIALLWLSSLRVLLAKRALSAVIRRVQRAAFKGELGSGCPHCGQPLAAPRVDASFSCPQCNVELLSSDGVIVLKSERAVNRVKAWTLRANTLVEADRLSRQYTVVRDRLLSRLIIASNVVLPTIGLLILLFGEG